MTSKRHHADLRTTPALIKEIDRQRDDLIRHFESLISLASSEKSDRNAAAQESFQMKVSTGQLISTAEELQTLIRNLQEMWLFGQLDTLKQSEARRQTDGDARVVEELLGRLAERQDRDESVEMLTTDGKREMQGVVNAKEA